LEAKKGNPRGIPRNSPGMHNLVSNILSTQLKHGSPLACGDFVKGEKRDYSSGCSIASS
jgi:hypothetical protein